MQFVRYCFKCFEYIYSFNPHSSPTYPMYISLSAFFQRVNLILQLVHTSHFYSVKSYRDSIDRQMTKPSGHVSTSQAKFFKTSLPPTPGMVPEAQGPTHIIKWWWWPLRWPDLEQVSTFKGNVSDGVISCFECSTFLSICSED